MDRVINLHGEGPTSIFDTMMYLNVAHTIAYTHSCSVNFHLYWPDDESWVYHYEDPETLIDRTHYIHSFYKDCNEVSITNIFNSKVYHTNTHKFLKKVGIATDQEVNSLSMKEGKHLWHSTVMCLKMWMLDETRLQPTIPNKISFWRPTNNLNPTKAERFLNISHDQWDQYIHALVEQGFTVVELDHRTPINEVLYHISTSESVIGYGGMYSLISAMLFKPTLLVDSAAVAVAQNPNAILVNRAEVLDKTFRDWNLTLQKMHKYSEHKHNKFKRLVESKQDWNWLAI